VFDGGEPFLGIIRSFSRKLAPLQERIARLEEALARSQAVNFSDAYRGVWREDDVYKIGDLCTHGGSMWAAEQDPVGKPGPGDPSGWRLVVKCGRNGKDAPPADLAKVVALEHAVAALNRRIAKLEGNH
jgi:hypothetical protein